MVMSGGYAGSTPGSPHSRRCHLTRSRSHPSCLTAIDPSSSDPPHCPLMVQGGYTALMLAATEGHDDIVDLLVKAGASLDVQEKEVGGHGGGE